MTTTGKLFFFTALNPGGLIHGQELVSIIMKEIPDLPVEVVICPAGGLPPQTPLSAFLHGGAIYPVIFYLRPSGFDKNPVKREDVSVFGYEITECNAAISGDASLHYHLSNEYYPPAPGTTPAWPINPADVLEWVRNCYLPS